MRREIYSVILAKAGIQTRSRIKPAGRQARDDTRYPDALAVYGYNHKKVKHSEKEFAREDGSHINGVKSYWSWTKRRLAKFNGIAKRQFGKHLLESEWRFNHRHACAKDLKQLLKKV